MPPSEPSITIWVETETQSVTVKVRAQQLAPAEYGIIIASVVAHIAKLFAETNPHKSEQEIVSEIERGLGIGLAQRKDLVLPQKPH